jgi:DNA modification methylase
MTPYYADDWLTVMLGDCRQVMAEMEPESVHCVVTSPPYWGLRDYGQDGQLGLEPTPEAYVESMVAVFREVRRVLRSDGTVWLNLGDSYAASNVSGPQGTTGDRASRTFTARTTPKMADGLKPKDLVGIPWRVAFALQADGWYLRSDIVWAKPNPMPESVTDRPTKAHEYLFLLSKSPRYYYDADAVREPHTRDWSTETVGPGYMTAQQGRNDGGKRQGDFQHPAGRNLRSVWTIATQPYPGAHFATFPQALVEPCIKAGTSEKGVCPECGAPWERVVERTNATRRGDGAPSVAARLSGGLAVGSANHMGSPEVETTGWKPPYVAPSEIDRYGTGQAGVHRKVGGQYQKWLDEHPKQTVGWNGPCKHEGDPIPATVLDPFAGSGTTGLVAQRLSRRAVLIDLNGEYLEQVMDRNRDIPLGLGA